LGTGFKIFGEGSAVISAAGDKGVDDGSFALPRDLGDLLLSSAWGAH
jgi:hypothetical protein